MNDKYPYGLQGYNYVTRTYCDNKMGKVLKEMDHRKMIGNQIRFENLKNLSSSGFNLINGKYPEYEKSNEDILDQY